MMTFIAGGASSGKSRYAEQLASRLFQALREGRRVTTAEGHSAQERTSDPALVYLATMQTAGEEAVRRIAHHRKQRERLAFLTVEQALHIGNAAFPDGSVVLLEDIGNLCANEMFDEGGCCSCCGNDLTKALVENDATRDITECAGAIAKDVRTLADRCAHLVIVSVEAGCGGTDFDDMTRSYLQLLGTVNRMLAGSADNVCEVAAGMPVYHKGREPVAVRADAGRPGNANDAAD